MEKKRWDIHCPACKRKFLKEEIEELGFIDKTKVGDVINCPNCEYQWIDNIK